MNLRRAVSALTVALALVCSTGVAQASVLVVDWAQGGGTTNDIFAWTTARVATSMLERQKPEGGYLVIPPAASKTLWARQGQHFTASGAALTFDAVLHINWAPGRSVSGFNPDSMFRGSTSAAKWPTVPQVFVGPSSSISGKLTQTASCSTGVTSNNGSSSTAYAIYSTKGTQVYRQALNQVHIAAVASRPAGIYRVLLAFGAGVGTQGTLCTDCDAITRASASAAESVVVVARYRSATDAAPLIIANIGQSAGSVDPIPLKVGLTLADSIAGRGKVVGKEPLKTAVMLSGLFRTDNTSSGLTPTVAGNGIFAPASGAVDTLNQRAIWDSLGALKIPFSVAVQTDSAQKLTYQRALLRKAPLAKLTPQDYAGITHNFTSTWGNAQYTRSAGVSNAGTASRYRALDPWGETRARTWKPVSGWTCTTADTGCAPCLIQWAFERCDSISRSLGLSGVDRVVWAPNTDWTPSDVTRANATKLDSVLYAAYRAGVKGFVTTPDVLENYPGLYSGAQPLGWGGEAARLPVRESITSGPRIGTVALLAARGGGSQPNASTTHDHLNEQAHGWLAGGPWFAGNAALPQPGPFYYHDFFPLVNLYTVPVGSLGGVADGTTPRAWGWWQIKGLKGVVDMVNSYATPGSTVLQIVYPEELAN